MFSTIFSIVALIATIITAWGSVLFRLIITGLVVFIRLGIVGVLLLLLTRLSLRTTGLTWVEWGTWEIDGHLIWELTRVKSLILLISKKYLKMVDTSAATVFCSILSSRFSRIIRSSDLGIVERPKT